MADILDEAEKAYNSSKGESNSPDDRKNRRKQREQSYGDLRCLCCLLFTLSNSTFEEITMSEATPTPQDLKAALKAFKKRLKLTRLDAESSLGGGPLSSGRGSGIVAIVPPNQFPPAVWDELVKQGKLKKMGGGTYELVEP
jgi:hypothetical protein